MKLKEKIKATIENLKENRKKKIIATFIESLDTLQGNLLLKYLLEREDREKLRFLLMEVMFPRDFEEPIDERKMFVIAKRLNKDENATLFIKSRATRNYRAYILAKPVEQDMIRGRLLEDESIIQTFERSEFILNNWATYLKDKDKKKKFKEFVQRTTGNILNIKQ